LIELLVVLAIISLLAGLLLPAVMRARESGRAVYCLNQMKQIGMGIARFTDRHDGYFPRSQHSAFSRGELTWARVIAPELGSSATAWRDLLASVYRCPSDPRPNTLSYGLNVYFELGPDDGYEEEWRRVASIPNPSATILLAENSSSADHIMPNFWATPQDADGDLAHRRHQQKANYLFVDGHVERRALAGVYDPANGIDAWNPAVAR
jgi:prepilin-type processing-associated H-X9-DG protein